MNDKTIKRTALVLLLLLILVLPIVLICFSRYTVLWEFPIMFLLWLLFFLSSYIGPLSLFFSLTLWILMVVASILSQKNGRWKWVVIVICVMDFFVRVFTFFLTWIAVLIDIIAIVLAVLCAKKVEPRWKEKMDAEKEKEKEK